MKKIESPDSIRHAISTFPNSRATRDAQQLIDSKGTEFGSYLVEKPLYLDNEKYLHLTRQLTSYFRVCEKLAESYTHDQHIRSYIQGLVLQFEDPQIQKLVKEYPLTTLNGARFGTDTMSKDDGMFTTAEVNIGPVGGPAENIAAQKLLDDDFPISGDLYLDHFIWSLHSYYLRACNTMGITPKAFKERQLVYVENNGWFPGSFDMVNYLKTAGVNITILPREELIYEPKTNSMYFTDGGEKVKVDQLVLYFHLQEDLPGNQADKAEHTDGQILQALDSHAVVADTSMFPLLVLASKSIGALISQMADEPDGLLAQRLGVDTQDLIQVKDMFANTYHWRTKFFSSLTPKERFNIDNYLATNNLIIKSTRTDLYGGQGIFGAGNRGKRDYHELYDDIKVEIGKKVIQRHDSKILTRLVDQTVLSNLQSCVVEQDANTSSSETDITALLDSIISGGFRSVNGESTFSLNPSEIEKASYVYETLQAGSVDSAIKFNRFINDFAYLVTRGLGVEPSEKNVGNITNNLISYLSTCMVLPYVIQERVVRETKDELRISGFIADKPENNVALFSTIKVVDSQTKPITLYPINPEQIPERSSDRTHVEESKILEVEATAPIESTALELATILQDKHYNNSLVLMCGAGRHAQYLAPYSDHVVGIDISPKFINEAARLSSGIGNIHYDIADVREYVTKPEVKESSDLAVLLGLGLGYLTPQEQVDLLHNTHTTLTAEGTVIFDVVNLDKFGELLKLQGPVGSRFIHQNRRALERLTRREIVPVTNDFFAIQDTTSYITDTVFETMNERSTYYVPTPEGIQKMLIKIGYEDIQIGELFDSWYVGMLRHRWVVTAKK